ncbi:MAG: insulinase family protein [Methanomassiliicoccales archaeon]|nr:insulinase family protein [Methanomassiliicoccales archaeon]
MTQVSPKRKGRKVDQSISIGTTEGGIKVIVENVPHVHTVALSVTAEVGSRDERKEESGISHFLEHMLFRGTKTRDFRQVNEMIETSGGYLNAYTTNEFTCFYTFTIDESLNVGEDLLSDLFLNPRMDQSLVDLERNIVKQEIGMRMNEPSSHLRTKMMEVMFKGNPLARSILGTPSSLDAFDSDFLSNFHRSHYHPPHVVVCAVGNVDPQRVLEWAGRFDHVSGEAAPLRRKVPKHNTGTHFFVKGSDRAYIGLGTPAFSAAYELATAQSVLSTILCGGTSSRLSHRIREVEGLVYSISMYPLTFKDCGSMMMYCSTSMEQVPRLFDSYGQEMARLKKEGLEEVELDKARNVLKGSLLRNACRPDQNMSSHLYEYLEMGRVQSIEEQLHDLNAVTVEQVMKVVDVVLKREKVCTTICAGEEMRAETVEAADSLDF